jgi:hypothetical protein
MLKKLNLLVILASALLLAGFLVSMGRGEKHGPLRVRGKAIEIYGQGYTLARLAKEINDPAIFTYDPDRRFGVAKASLTIHGSLQVGHPSDPSLGETLELDTVVCGDLSVRIASGGTLQARNAIVQTVSKVITAETCSKGYALFVDGTLDAADSRFLYMSGSRSETARRGSTVKLDNVTFSLSDGTAFRCVGADGESVDIRDSKFSCEGQYGFIIDGSGGAPIRLVDCSLRGSAADLQMLGRGPEAELVDCRFGRNKVKFYHRSGQVVVRWSVKATVVEKGSGKPIPGVEVVAIGTGGGREETVQQTSAEDGTCDLVLTEYAATPEATIRLNGENNVTPHRIVARSREGTVLAEVESYDARGSHGTVTLEVPAGDVTAGR